MPYKDSSKQRAYQRNRNKEARTQWVKDHGPCRKCGSDQNLEVDHIDPSTKTDHRVWSWSKERRDKELEKCQVLCRNCHSSKTREERFRHGTSGYKRGCRCNNCRTAKSKERRDRYLRLGK